MPPKKTILILGDTFTFAVITIIGFATHGEAAVTLIPRMGTTFFPLLISWFLIGPWLGLFDEPVLANPKSFWRILLALAFSTPLAVILRAALLHSSAMPLFALVLAGTNTLGLLAWRMIYFFIVGQNKPRA